MQRRPREDVCVRRHRTQQALQLQTDRVQGAESALFAGMHAPRRLALRTVPLRAHSSSALRSSFPTPSLALPAPTPLLHRTHDRFLRPRRHRLRPFARGWARHVRKRILRRPRLDAPLSLALRSLRTPVTRKAAREIRATEGALGNSACGVCVRAIGACTDFGSVRAGATACRLEARGGAGAFRGDTHLSTQVFLDAAPTACSAASSAQRIPLPPPSWQIHE